MSSAARHQTLDRVPTVPAAEALDAALVIDLRSPSEFALDHLPDARNIPLFDDSARHSVGWLYGQRSAEEAFEEGRARILERIEDLVREVCDLAGWTPVPHADLRERVLAATAGGIMELDQRVASLPAPAARGRRVVLHCWRGGLRSRSVVALLRSLGFDEAVGLEGGYKAYRSLVRETLDQGALPRAFVLRGLTGVGKTLVLREIERLRPGWTLDLEGLAGHRNSLLGMVGLEPVSQKAFESRIAARLARGFPGFVVLEGESRRVGDAIVPECLWRALRAGEHLLLEASTERRVDILMEDYLAVNANRAPLARQLAQVQARMQAGTRLVELFESGRERELVRILLEQYYDPLYRHSEREITYAAAVDSSDSNLAALRVIEHIHREVELP